jgi:hypothetical protein
MIVAGPFTVRDLELMFGESTPVRIQFNMMLATTHDRRVEQVEAAIDWIAQEHAKTRQHRYERDEDALTIDVITELRAMGFDASHDKDYGGHGDIVIEARDEFLWIAEAKIHSTYGWLLKGFQQLDTRYATGLPGQDTGGLIIYCKAPRVDQIMDRWTDYLRKRRPDVQIEVCTNNPLNRRSVHAHERTGRPFKIRHVPISLYFDPKD